MSIKKIDSCSAICDHCGEVLETDHEGFTIFVDEQATEEAIDSADWFKEDGYEESDLHYCKACYWIDDNEEMHLRMERRKDRPAPNSGDRASSDPSKEGASQSQGEIPQMSHELSAQSDVAALEYGKLKDFPILNESGDVMEGYDIGTDLTEAHEAGQIWMYRKLMERREAIDLMELVPGISAKAILQIVQLNNTSLRDYEKALFASEQQVKALQFQLSSMKDERDEAIRKAKNRRERIAGLISQRDFYKAERDMCKAERDEMRKVFERKIDALNSTVTYACTEAAFYKKAWEDATAILEGKNLEIAGLREEANAYKSVMKDIIHGLDGFSYGDMVEAISKVFAKYKKEEQK